MIRANYSTPQKVATDILNAGWLSALEKDCFSLVREILAEDQKIVYKEHPLLSGTDSLGEWANVA